MYYFKLGAILSSIVILFVILFIGPLFEPLPKAILASIISVALKGLLFQIKDLFSLWKINRIESVSFIWDYCKI